MMIFNLQIISKSLTDSVSLLKLDPSCVAIKEPADAIEPTFRSYLQE